MDRVIPIIDSHQHFWDLTLGKHPWLCGDHDIPFRYGDYTSLKEQNYLVEDYLADTAGFNILKTVYVETEWDPADPLGETRWVMELHNRTGFPHAIIGQAWFMAEDVANVLANQATSPLMRSIRQKPVAAPTRSPSTCPGHVASQDRQAAAQPYAVLPSGCHPVGVRRSLPVPSCRWHRSQREGYRAWPWHRAETR